ncbi:MAG: TolC family protein [candidate division Zixibacteria bacterium]|nr:TolC family protein [candidate division Zixibacteria bacterium]
MMRIRSILISVVFFTGAAAAETMTLEKTLDRLVHQSTRGQIIAGQLEVAQAKFKAERIGYYLPEITFNTTLPTYISSQNYDTYPGYTDPLLFTRSDLSGDANIRLRQKVITGGEITMETQYNLRNNEYPSAVYGDNFVISGFATATDKRRLGNLYVRFSQPIFQTSATRSSYLETRDNLDKAEIEWRVNRTDLKREGITAFFDYLSADLDRQSAQCQSDLAAFNAQWDSVKFGGGVITEESWVTSRGKRLEKQLGVYDAEAAFQEKVNAYKHLLDLPMEAEVTLEIPPIAPLPDSEEAQRYLDRVDRTAETELAAANVQAAERTLDQTRSSYGINASLDASYAFGRGTVTQSKPEREIEDKIDTKDWQVSLNLTYPIWDGGASGASIHSQELAYESARLQYVAAERSARTSMTILLKRIEINHAKLVLLEQELAVAEKKLRDAEGRHAQGLLSDGGLLENRSAWLETRKKQLTTLKDYYLDLTQLEKTDVTE